MKKSLNNNTKVKPKVKSKIKISFMLFVMWFGLTWYFLPRPLFKNDYSTAVYDNEDALIGGRISKDGQWRFLSKGKISKRYISCLLAFEDRRFFQHWGIDPVAIFGALKNNIGKHKHKRGGSTITMQLMRLSYMKKNRSIFSKLIEANAAFFYELTHSKNEILKQYADHAPFGGNVVGFEAACWRYFQKSPEALTWGESATLAVLPNAPGLIHVGKNRDRLQEKRDQLLLYLKGKKIIDSIEYELAIGEPIPLKPKPLPNLSRHLLDHLQANHSGTFTFHTSIDREIQEMTNDMASFYQTQYLENQISNIAILVIENKTGQVLSYVGNAGNANGHAVDMIQAQRSSGSILKPFLYCALLDQKYASPKSLVADIPISINGFSPKNFDQSFHGAIPFDEALQRSLNIPFVLELRNYGVDKFKRRLNYIGIKSVNKTANHYGLSLILGGAEVSLWEVCGAYSSMARIVNHFSKNNSNYFANDIRQPSLLKNEATNFDSGKTIKDSEQLWKAGSIFMTFDALKGLKRPDEEGLWEEFSSSKLISWKTGTSFGHKDAWAIGVDANYTVGIWVGNANGSSRSHLTGVKAAAPVLFDVFNRLPDGRWFDKPWDDLTKTLICKKSGHKASPICVEIDTSYINNSSLESPVCHYHKRLFTTCDGQFQVLKDCMDESNISESSAFILPPEQTAFYTFNHSDYSELPPFHEACARMHAELNGEDFAIIYPNEFTRIFMPKDISGNDQSAIFQANHSSKDGKLFWQMDDEYLGETSIFHTMKIDPKPGKHKLTVMNETGRQKIKYFEVVME